LASIEASRRSPFFNRPLAPPAHTAGPADPDPLPTEPTDWTTTPISSTATAMTRHRQICHLKKERTASREEERRKRFTDPKRENLRTDLD